MTRLETIMRALFVALLLLMATLFHLPASAQEATVSAVKPGKPATISDQELAAVKEAEAARIAAIEKVYGSVVAIYGNDRQGGGSGVLYDPAGYALTNHHVVAAAGDEGWAGLADGKLYRWKLLGTDPGGDVAIIRLEGRDDFPVARIGDSETVQIGDWAMAMGNPFVLAEDQRPTVTLGIVSGTHRYQPGEGTNTLVYGNCIQVDSSINPGNSGGPLFNLRGEVIGINGRGSFEERGRVNVGLGYAISANQVKNFIPDLLATRVVQHGTLDAQFGNRTGGVICQTLNLNAPIARLGLELGDRLIAFEGVEITNANQFTNLITTYPADWPCEVTFERSGVRKTVHVRLTPLPYNLSKPGAANPRPPRPGEPAPMPMPEEPMPEEKPAEGEEPKPPAEKPEGEGNDDSKPAGEEKPEGEEKPDDAPMERKEIKPVRIVPQRAPLEPGKIRFPEMNRESVAHLFRQGRLSGRDGASEPPAALEVSEELRSSGEKAGTVTLIIAADQRFVARRERKGDSLTLAFDGESYWRQDGDDDAEEVSFEKAMRDPLGPYALAMGCLIAGRPHESLGNMVLQGGDKAQRQISYRIAAAPNGNDPVYLWLSVFDADGDAGVSLLKSGIGIHDDEPVPALAYSQWQETAGVNWPHRKVQVKGFAESPGDEIVTQSVKPAEITEATFRMPQS
jgi:serine protease Do